mgnify:CR=1 FL=1
MNTLINGLNRGLGFAIPSNLANEIRPAAGRREENCAALAWDSDRIGRRQSEYARFAQGNRQRVVVRTIEADAPANKE